MLEFLKVKNIALIDELAIDFGEGLNLLTGETGSGKSIIVDSLGTLTGDRVTADLIRSGQETARIEGIFSVPATEQLRSLCDDAGIELDQADTVELIVRRELSLSGKNRIFINGQLATQSLLKQIGPLLVAIHGQGEHTALFDPRNHLDILDRFASTEHERRKTAEAFRQWNATRAELESLQTSEAEKLRLLDVLRFQIDEIKNARLQTGEETDLGEEKLRLSNVEKLSSLSSETYSLLYDDPGSTFTTLEKAARKVEELASYDSRFVEYLEPVRSAVFVIEDLAMAARDYGGKLEFSPKRLEEIEDRLAEISRLTRKYGGSVDSVIAHLTECEGKLVRIETSELREKERRDELAKLRDGYVAAARVLHDKRAAAAAKFEKAVERDLKTVAFEKARFEARIEFPAENELAESAFNSFTAAGMDNVEFFFSANAGEPVKPLARVASGGEASRLMLILKTTAGADTSGATAIFDEIDAGIGGRVAEAVGAKLKALAGSQQVLCVTHQPQVASKADRHFVIEKSMKRSSTAIAVRQLDATERIDEVARMLAGEKITEAARENAREMIAAAG